MKTYTTLIIVMLLTGCANKYIDNDFYVDYNKHFKDEFFISTYDYFGKYEPVGHLFIERYNRTESIDNGKPQGYGESPYSYNKIRVTPQMVIDELVKSAKLKGADGLINVNYERIKEIHSGRNYYYIKYIGYYAEGMAIKRME